MDAGLVVAVALAVAFAVTNGFLDAANSIAALVATRAATPLQAIVLASVFNLLGPLLLGAAVANTIGGIVSVTPSADQPGDRRGARRRGDLEPRRVEPRAAVELRRRRWSAVSSGAALAEGGIDAVNWGGVAGRPPGGRVRHADLAGGLAAARRARRAAGDPRSEAARRAGRRGAGARRFAADSGRWPSALAFSHGANDAQKSVGVIAALLLANGQISTLAAPTWVIARCARWR